MATRLTRTAPCRGCGKEIAFLKTAAGKSMPVNPDAVYFIPAGGPNTYVRPDGSVARGRAPGAEDLEKEIGYISHFATCPERDRFSKKTKSERTRE